MKPNRYTELIKDLGGMADDRHEKGIKLDPSHALLRVKLCEDTENNLAWFMMQILKELEAEREKVNGEKE